MAKSQHPTLHYRLITWALFPLALGYTLYTSLKHKSFCYFYQRFGYYKEPTQSGQLVWCHCASVGEINTALPLLRSLISQGKALVVSTNTITGYNTLSQAKLNNTHTVFLPLDYKFSAKKFIRHFQPKIALLFETELWPNVLLTMTRNNVPIAIINGRISDKTLKAPTFILKNYKRILQYTCKVFSSSDENTTRFISLGADPKIITTLDNLKFSGIFLEETNHTSKPLKYDYLLCASTHENEEKEILRAWENQSRSKLGLVIALRHPKRIQEVIQTLKELNLSYQLHSNNNSSPTSDKIYIIDTLGELMPFLAHATIVFMAGSLVPVGGHNMIEPAQYKRCIITGKHYDNFKIIVDDLKTYNAIEVVDTADELVSLSQSLYKDERKRTKMGEQAYRYIESKKNVLTTYSSRVSELLGLYDI